ncbi:hypothetical protein F5148DRAFT_1153230 [Russula earlei]|uniref:Uncharacterized protein n=1 Tax=Russula earlei TaxID=71964 RepID=A0ACC0TU57_9AGAM|nr:hypothetical protein F5148DRAFT_1153230 [Russula earlei]
MQQPGLEKHCTEVIFQLDNNLVITNIWPQKSETWGYATESLFQQKFSSLLSPSHQQPLEARVIPFLLQKDDNPLALEALIVLPNKKESWFSLLIKKESMAPGAMQCIIVATNIDHYKLSQQASAPISSLQETTDIAELKASLKKLEESEKRFRILAENLPTPVSCKTEDGKILFVNKAFSDLFGYTLKDVPTLVEWTQKTNAPLKTNITNTPWKEEWQRKRKELVGGIKRTVEITCKNGDVKTVEYTTALYDGLLYYLFIDVTEKKQREIQLLESYENFKRIAENLPVPIAGYNAGMSINFMNKKFTEVLGYQLEEIKDFDVWYAKFVFPDEATKNQLLDNWNNAVEAYRNGTAIVPYITEMTICCKNGEVKHFEISMSVDGDNVYGMFNDITERKVTESKLLQSHQQLRELTSYLQKIREEERKHIAREIHDELGQMVTGLKMDISMCKKTVGAAMPEMEEKIAGIVELTDKIVKTIRRIASELRPNILDDIGLVATMQWQSREFEKRSGLKCQFETNLEDDAALPADVCSNVFRIFQETLTNVMRHAQATKVVASLIQKENRLLLTITDDGKGFNTLEKQKTLGLLGMRERAIMLNGSFSINSVVDKGTTTTVEVTLQ